MPKARFRRAPFRFFSFIEENSNPELFRSSSAKCDPSRCRFFLRQSKGRIFHRSQSLPQVTRFDRSTNAKESDKITV
ncbi:hypothetical protein CH376_08850 [Leptospira adleri]|uniref:Uncharacterized protein n=1 Tax=Leptospira adleri TaxID=2023186 RepID=A0ABX4NZL3_9LEPT|nr:hypothetical protein CH376_08850 [Leptospira adleri]